MERMEPDRAWADTRPRNERIDRCYGPGRLASRGRSILNSWFLGNAVGHARRASEDVAKLRVSVACAPAETLTDLRPWTVHRKPRLDAKVSIRVDRRSEHTIRDRKARVSAIGDHEVAAQRGSRFGRQEDRAAVRPAAASRDVMFEYEEVEDLVGARDG